MDSNGDTPDTSRGEVNTLISTISGQMTSIQLQLNQGTSNNTNIRGSPRPAGLASNGEITSTSSVGRFVDENLEHGDPPLPAFLAEHNVAEALMRANTLHLQRHGTHAVDSPRFVPHVSDGFQLQSFCAF
jgi:hypothetical protein